MVVYQRAEQIQGIAQSQKATHLFQLFNYNWMSNWHICQKSTHALKLLKMKAAEKKKGGGEWGRGNSGFLHWPYPALHII